MDRDGYPEEHELETITKWDPMDFLGLIDYVQARWYYPEAVKHEGKVWEFITGGWSGNEDLIRAMEENPFWWALHWYQSTRGGSHIFCKYGDDPE
jgi:hypothetical protein